MELDLQSLFGLLCTAVLIGGDPATPPPPLPTHSGAIGQPRQTTSLCNPWIYWYLTLYLYCCCCWPPRWCRTCGRYTWSSAGRCRSSGPACPPGPAQRTQSPVSTHQSVRGRIHSLKVSTWWHFYDIELHIFQLQLLHGSVRTCSFYYSTERCIFFVYFKYEKSFWI